MKCKLKYLENRACWIHFYGLPTCIWTKDNNALAGRHVGFVMTSHEVKMRSAFFALGTSLPLPNNIPA